MQKKKKKKIKKKQQNKKNYHAQRAGMWLVRIKHVR